MRKLSITFILAILLAIMPVFMPGQVQALERPELISPIGTATGTSVLFQWSYEGNVDEFRLEVWQGDDLIFKEYLDEDICNDGSSDYGIDIDVGSATNEINLLPGYEYQWKVRAYYDTDSSAWSYSENFWYETIYDLPAIMISPISGDVGTSVTIHGYGWEDGEDIEIYVEREEVKTLRHVDSTWTTKIAIDGYGSQSIKARGSETGWSNPTWFLVNPPDVDIKTSSPGTVGSTIKVSGDNWPENETISLTFNYRFVGSISSGDGSWQDSFICPELPAGEWPIEAYSRYASAVDYFEIEPTLTLSPESTGPSQPVMAKGQGFASSASIRIALNTGTFYANTNTNGTFTKEIRSPAESGNYIVEARDSRGNTATADLSIGGIVNISPAVLCIGDTLTIRGSSFSPGYSVDIECDSRKLISGEVDNFGNFTITTKPILTAGKHTITASDRKVSASATLEVESVTPDIPLPWQPFDNKILFGKRISIVWLDVQDCSSVIYEVRISSDTNNIVAMSTVSGGKTSLVVPGDGTYYWQVRAIDGAGNTSNWSSLNSFSVRGGLGLILTILGVVVAAVIIAVSWLYFRRKK